MIINCPYYRRFTGDDKPFIYSYVDLYGCEENFDQARDIVPRLRLLQTRGALSRNLRRWGRRSQFPFAIFRCLDWFVTFACPTRGWVTKTEVVKKQCFIFCLDFEQTMFILSNVLQLIRTCSRRRCPTLPPTIHTYMTSLRLLTPYGYSARPKSAVSIWSAHNFVQLKRHYAPPWLFVPSIETGKAPFPFENSTFS